MLVGSDPSAHCNGSATSQIVTVSVAMLNITRWGGLLTWVRSVHCAAALTAAIHTVGIAPSANNDQKFTRCASERFDAPLPSGSSILIAEVMMVSPSKAMNNRQSFVLNAPTETARLTAPIADTAAT